MAAVRWETMEDPYEVLGVRPEASSDAIRVAYRGLVRQHHPDRHRDEDPKRQAARHARMAEITAAFRMLNDPAELERFRRLQLRRARGSASSEPGRDGVRFTASSSGAVEPAPGDPDFDYRERAPSEFYVSNDVGDRAPWTARQRTRGSWRRRAGR